MNCLSYLPTFSNVEWDHSRRLRFRLLCSGWACFCDTIMPTVIVGVTSIPVSIVRSLQTFSTVKWQYSRRLRFWSSRWTYCCAHGTHLFCCKPPPGGEGEGHDTGSPYHKECVGPLLLIVLCRGPPTAYVDLTFFSFRLFQDKDLGGRPDIASVEEWFGQRSLH